jgi:putative methyltransferase (TIGR04325 family)
MAKIKELFKAVIPPILLKVLSLRTEPKQEIWSGDFANWAEAVKASTGYNSEEILEKCKLSLLKVKNGEAAYERDSVLFDKIEYSWGLLAGLQKAGIENSEKLIVLDFGGSLGSSYYQNIQFLNPNIEVEWCIVEQRAFVDCGREYFQNNELSFYYDIDECLEKHKPNVLLLSSVLQYLEKPYEWIEKFSGLDIDYIIVDRTAFTANEKNLLTVQNVPESIYRASYPAWFFSLNEFLDSWKGYEILASFDSGYTDPLVLNGTTNAFWNGLIMKK